MKRLVAVLLSAAVLGATPCHAQPMASSWPMFRHDAQHSALGDVTGASNSQAEITQYRFLQGASTGARPSTWGRIKSLYR